MTAYLLRALRWLETMRLALMQARKWLRRGCGLLSLPCYRDAWHLARLAGQDLRCWRDCTVAAQEAVSGPVASWQEFLPFDWGSVECEHQLEVRGS